jgi:hypothetical protein
MSRLNTLWLDYAEAVGDGASPWLICMVRREIVREMLALRSTTGGA